MSLATWAAAAWLTLSGAAPPGYGLAGGDWASPVPDPSLSTAARQGLEAVVMRSLSRDERGCFFYAVVDLDGDGLNELLVQVRGNFACGDIGCPLVAFRWKDLRLLQFSRTEWVRNVGLVAAQGRGLRPLVVAQWGGEYRELRARNGRYPKDPTGPGSRKLEQLPTDVTQAPWIAAAACAMPSAE